jgi:hypothetical protein
MNTEDVKDIWDAILAMPLVKPVAESRWLRCDAYGAVHSQELGSTQRTPFCWHPFIIDSRLTDKSEVYYDEEKWKQRVREQNEFEAPVAQISR